jgi:ketosteroid isomerase-like protein
MTVNDATAARLEDERAIRRLVDFYCDAVTHRDAVRAASIFTEDGVISIDGAELHGRAAIEAGMAQTFAAYDILQQIAHAPMVTVDGDRATGRWSTVELTVKHGDSGLGVIFGHYESEAVRRPEGWRFTRRTFRMAGRTLLETARLKLHPGFAHALQFPL